MAGYKGIGRGTTIGGIGGEGYEFAYSEEVGEYASFSIQAPANEGISDAIVLEYGAGGVTSDEHIQVHSNGEIEILKAGKQHQIDVFIRLSRTNATGVAVLHLWLEVALDGVNFSQPADSFTITQEMDDTTTASRETGTFYSDPYLPVGTRYRLKFARGAGGPNQGELQPFIMSGTFTGLTNSPSASVAIRAHAQGT